MSDKQLANATFDKLGLVNALTESKVKLAKINEILDKMDLVEAEDYDIWAKIKELSK